MHTKFQKIDALKTAKYYYEATPEYENMLILNEEGNLFHLFETIRHS